MSGHSKWSTIKHKKALIDSKRAVTFQKFSRELMVAAKLGGSDVSANFRLRTAVEKAKAAGLPNDNIKRAIEKGAGGSDGGNYEELTYEGYGAGGVAVFIEAMTDNRNRTAGDIRSYFTKFNGNLGETGCVGWMFKPVGHLFFASSNDFDKLFELAIEAGADDLVEFQTEDEDGDEITQYKMITTPENFQKVVEFFDKQGIKPVSEELTRVPENSIEVTDKKIATNLMRLINNLEEHDDVQNVYANFDINDDLMNELDV